MNNLSNDTSIMTAADVSKFLHICRVNTYKLFQSKGFPCIKIGKSLRVSKADLMNYLKSNTININSDN